MIARTMNSILANHPIDEKEGFWGRQLSGAPTPAQIIFDIVFGILLPLFCFYFDPGIVKGGFSTPIGRLGFLIYAFSGLAITTLFLWLLFGNRMRAAKSVLAGVLVAGAIVASSIGVLILPLTLIGILAVIGLLGLVPFFTGFVYLRNALRAMHCGGRSGSRPARFVTVLVSAMVAIALPSGAQWTANKIVEQSFAEILDQDAPSFDAPVARIKRLHLIFDTDRFIREYEKESNPARRERLALAYKGITGDEIERRLSVLND